MGETAKRRGGPGRFGALKAEALAANLEIPKLGLAILTWGNASAFDPELGAFAIKPSGVEYGELGLEDMVVVDLEGKVIEGDKRPSSDTKTHLALYRAWKGIRGVCHTHSAHAAAWAQARRDIPCLGTTHADQSAEAVPCTAMILPEEVERDYELCTGELIVRTFAERGLDPRHDPMVLVAGHGPFAWGGSAMAAVRNAAALEELARMAILTLGLDPGAAPLPEHVLRKHWERKHGPGAYYGQR
ncbi:MAG TPA: L-ribulose-5-phosphate 4-epimerase AraD [Spirochaetales bacterium]|nr:L-ribulose-5-phosphate 4-epimerase AraD [Spirochaetales bacterium]HRZ64248.1 L-ribulose-5-phosphate 4-epimerase AraD [Spirochaetia bacterium]